MIFSSSKQFIFFAVPKTGTHSVREALRPTLSQGDWEQQQLTGRMLSPIDEIAALGHGHISYQQLSHAVDPEILATYFSFAFVRHPIERFMSVCAFLARTDPEYDSDPVAWAKRAFQFERFRQRVLVRPQAELLTNRRGEIALSFIGRYEAIERDVNLICQQIGTPPPQLKKRNVTGNTKPAVYEDVAFTQELESFYEKEFNLLGYSRN